MAVKSAERVFRIFELLEQSPEGLTNKEVSSLLGFAPSSTLALLQTMEENGYLSADEQKRYYLGGSAGLRDTDRCVAVAGSAVYQRYGGKYFRHSGYVRGSKGLRGYLLRHGPDAPGGEPGVFL